MDATLYYSLACSHCIRFLKLLDSLPDVSKRVRRIQVGRRAPRNLLMVPAIVIGSGNPIYGEKAFEWLKNESSQGVKPFTLADQASPNAGMAFTFLEDETPTAGVETAPPSGLDALIAQRNAEVAGPIARA
jgi:hypothetical protein